MSRTPYVPDPAKWMSANKPERPLSLHRPLVDPQFRAHVGIATPPSTGRKQRGSVNYRSNSLTGSQSIKKVTELNVKTPTAATRGITSYLTPPTTGTGQRARVKQNGDAVTDSTRSRNARAMEFLDRVSQANTDTSHDERKRRGSPSGAAFKDFSSPVPDIIDLTESQDNVSVSVSHHFTDTTPFMLPLSVRQLTQVPDQIFERHMQLCRQDSSSRRRDISPWRRLEVKSSELNPRFEGEEPACSKGEHIRRRRKIAVRENVDSKAVQRAPGAREHRALGESKSLVNFSSPPESSTNCSPTSPYTGDHHGQPLAPLRANAIPLRRYVSAIEEDTLSRRKNQAPSRSLLFSPRNSAAVRLLPSSDLRGSATTPRKRPGSHYEVTPPKSRNLSTKDYHEGQETLFEFPMFSPPRQTELKLATEPQQTIKAWRPLDMEPETLMTWSLGGNEGQPTVAINDEDNKGGEIDVEGEGEVGGPEEDSESIAQSLPSQSFPCLFESSSLKRIEAESPINQTPSFIDPESARLASVRSPVQSLPFVRLSTDDSVGGIVEPADLQNFPMKLTPDGSQGKRRKGLVRRSNSAHRASCNPHLFSSLSFQSQSSQQHPKSIRSPTGPSRPRHNPTPLALDPCSSSKRRINRDKSQLKLEAFGYFASPPLESEEAAFDSRFSDDEDLQFDADEELSVQHQDDVHLTLPHTFTHSPLSALAPVPNAPPHPSLQTAGIREVERRERRAMERHHAQRQVFSSPVTVGTGTTDLSSSLGPEDEPHISDATRRWWDHLGGKDSSF